MYTIFMNILIVTGNPKKENHTDIIKTTYKDTVEKSGHEVKLINVYAEEFSLPYSNPEKGSLDKESEEKIKKMQEMIMWANEIVIIHPIWWASMPAGLKNWADTIFTPRFAYKYTTEGKVEKLLTGKTAKVFATAGSRALFYHIPIVSLFTPLRIIWKYAILNFCGINLVEILVQDKMNTNNSCPPVGCFENFLEKIKVSATRH